MSRRGHEFTKFGLLAEEIAHIVKAMRAILDGEIVCLGADGRSRFYDLLFRREWPHFYAFDVLTLEGEDLRDRPLLERKRILKGILPRHDSRLGSTQRVAGIGGRYRCRAASPAECCRGAGVAFSSSVIRLRATPSWPSILTIRQAEARVIPSSTSSRARAANCNWWRE